MSNKESIRIGVLGAGHLGRIHVQQLCDIPAFKIVGVFDPHAEKRDAIAREFGVAALDSVDQLMGLAQAVDIVTPTTAHYSLALQALGAGLHAFIEKPVTVTSAEADDLLHAADSARRVVQVGHVERFNPAFQSALPYFSDPMFIEGHRLAQWNPRGTDVSVVLDLMIHDIDLVLHVVRSKVASVQASGVAVVSDTPDICNARIVFENGCVANLTASRISLKNMRKCRFFQRDAYISVDMLAKQAEIVRMRAVAGEADPFAVTIDLGSGKGIREISFEKPEVRPVNAIREELSAFAESILTGSTPKVTLGEAAEALRVALAVLESMTSSK